MKSYFILFCVTISLLTSCGVTEPTETFTSIDNFFSKYGVQKETFTFDAEQGGTFTTTKGTVITVPPDAFIFSTGIVTLEVRDIYTKTDMILSNVTPQSDGLPLISGGELWINFSQDTLSVFLVDEISVKMKRTQGNTPMQLYAGDPDPLTSNVNWTPNDTFPPVTIEGDFLTFTINGMLYYSPNLEGSWVNCDHPFDTYTSTLLNLNYDTAYGVISTFLSFDDYNTVVRLYYDAGTTTYYFAPLGYHCTIVSVAIKDEKLYTDFRPITIGNNQTLNMSLHETSAEKFNQDLEALN